MPLLARPGCAQAVEAGQRGGGHERDLERGRAEGGERARSHQRQRVEQRLGDRRRRGRAATSVSRVRTSRTTDRVGRRRHVSHSSNCRVLYRLRRTARLRSRRPKRARIRRVHACGPGHAQIPRHPPRLLGAARGRRVVGRAAADASRARRHHVRTGGHGRVGAGDRGASGPASAWTGRRASSSRAVGGRAPCGSISARR